MKWKLGDSGKTQKFQNTVLGRIQSFKRMAGLEVFQNLSIKTPVYTGNARWNWWCSVGKVDLKYEEHKNLSVDWSRAERVFLSFGADESLFISNSTPYIKRLNDGWSKQASARFIEMTSEGVMNRVNALAKEAIKENP